MSGVAGRSGGQRKPTMLKIVTGTARPDRLRAKEPMPPPAIPAAPDWLSAEARGYFEHLGELAGRLGVLAETDCEIVALAAHAFEEFRAADAIVARAGLLIERDSRYGRTYVRNPALAVRRDAWQRYRDALRAMGLDPVARSIVATLERPSAEEQRERAIEKRYFGA